MALGGIALYCAKLSQLARAKKPCDQALANAPHDPTVVFTAAIVHAIAGNSEIALNYLTMARPRGLFEE
jgi:hypothetical protein